MINTYVGLPAIMGRLEVAATAAVNNGANELVRDAQEYAPVDTGALAAGIHTTGARADGNGVTAHVQTGAESSEYAIPVHEGSEAHIIEAKNGKALFWPGASHPVKAVLHPGAPPNEFLEVPLLSMASRFQAKCKAAMRAAF